MEITIKAFGIAREIFGRQAITLEVENGLNTNSLRNVLEVQYPHLKQIRSYMVALNSEYAQGGELIQATDEIAIIPPVSGG